MSNKEEWFANWFHEKYDRLYPHRSESQAQTQVEAVVGKVNLSKSKPWIDLGCGAGRHLKVLQKNHLAFGMDLSEYLLKKASLKNTTRGDLRYLPFKEESFDAAFSFFTSFGYFESLEADIEVLKEYHRILAPQGIFFLDLMNKSVVLKSLPNENLVELDSGEKVTQTRFFENNQVCKDITWVGPTGETEMFYERVRMYTLDEMKSILDSIGFTILDVIGDEMGSVYDEKTSSRMSVILRK